MRNFYTLVLAVLIVGAVKSQENRPDFVSGELYVSIKKEWFFQLIDEKGEVRTQVFNSYFPEASVLEQIKEIESPFKAAKGHDLQRVLRIHLKNDAYTHAIQFYFDGHEKTDYAERVPMHYTEYTPDDLGTNANGQQYNLHLINAQAAWDISKGDKRVVVAIVDDAMQMNHPDLSNNIWINPREIPGNGIDDDQNGYVDDINGWDAGDNDNNPSPLNNQYTHGTHVGGITGATTDNGIGVASIGFNLSLMVVKATRTGQSSVTQIPRGYEGITYAANAGADIINCSWGGSNFSATGQSVVSFANSKGCILVAAMGNNGNDMVYYPASFPGVVSVASTNIDDTKSNFSNYASYTKISAPGANIRSTVTGSGYNSFSGTSMASPLVAGLLGLMKSHMLGITNTELLNCMYSTAVNIDNLNSGFVGKLGAGRINAAAALQCVDNIKSVPPENELLTSKQALCPGNSIQFDIRSTRGRIDSIYWEFPGGNPSTSNDLNPVVTYPTLGNFNVKVTSVNAFGTDTDTYTNWIEASDKGVSTAYNFTFDGGLQNSGFTVSGNANNDKVWKDAILVMNGDTHQVLMMDAYNSGSNGVENTVTSPLLDLRDFGNSKLTFNFAYAPRSSSANDSLFIEITKDGGMTYNTVASISLSRQWNINANSTSAFTPNSLTQWCEASNSCMSFNLMLLDRKDLVGFRLVHKGATNANNLYIDNIKIEGNCASFNQDAPAALFKANKNGGCDSAVIQFESLSENYPERYNWYFPGGTPEFSTEPNPKIIYRSKGLFPVVLWVKNVNGEDSLRLSNFIEITGIPSIQINASRTEICRGETIDLTASGGLTYQWSPLVAISSTTGSSIKATPPTSTTYRVDATNNVGCSNTATIAITVKESPTAPFVSKSGDVLIVPVLSNVGYQWFRDGVAIPSATSNTYTPTQSGFYEVELTNLSSGCGVRSIGGFQFTALSVSNMKGDLFQIWPNPSSDKLNLSDSRGLHLIHITDAQGREILNQKASGIQAEIEVSHLPSGIYIIRWANDGGYHQSKFVKH